MDGTPVTENIAASKNENSPAHMQAFSRFPSGNRREKSRASGMIAKRQGAEFMKIERIQNIVNTSLSEYMQKNPLKQVYTVQITDS